MAVKAIDLEEYTFISKYDTEEPKTKFFLTPMRKMEQFKVSAIASAFLGDDGKTARKINTGMMIEAADDTEKVIYGYLREHLVSVENFEKNGKLVNGNGEDFYEQVHPNIAMEIVMDAVARSRPDKEMEKN